MPLQAPDLDGRTFEELVEEARLRIPRYLPEWTDFNESDPGMALVQLFAWLTEMTRYKLNQTPDRNYIKFLQLLNMELEPAAPAIAHLTFTAQPDAPAVPSIPRFTQVEGQPLEGNEPLIFETEKGLDLIRSPLEKVIVYDGAQFRDFTIRNQPDDDATYRPLGWTPQVGNALYLGFQKGDPELAAPIFPQQMRFRVFLRLRKGTSPAQACSEAKNPPRPPVTLVWEYHSKDDPQGWRPLAVQLDETVAFTREGYIVVAGPVKIEATKEVRGEEDERYWLRCRLAKGAYAAGQEPEIDLIRPNVVAATNLSTVRNERVANSAGEVESDGRPNQIFTLRDRPVLDKSLKLQLVTNGATEDWCEVDDLLGSNADDPHYVLNANKGEIRFGDGQNGRIPVAGAEIVALEYRYGGGARGNVSAGNLSGLVTTPDGVEGVTNERAAVAGKNEESVDDFKKWAPHKLRSRGRAVTEEDFTALAMQAGGVARAEAIALRHPDFSPDIKVPGAVTVVIAPQSADRPPIPSPELLRSVCRHLDDYRLLTTEVYVTGPTYRAIRVEATVAAQPYASFGTVSQEVVRRLNQYLKPVSVKTNDNSPPEQSLNNELRSPDIEGDPYPEWEFGSDLHPTNLFAVILSTPNVVTVQHLEVLVDGVPLERLDEPVVMPADGLVYGVEEHEIVVVANQDL